MRLAVCTEARLVIGKYVPRQNEYCSEIKDIQAQPGNLCSTRECDGDNSYAMKTTSDDEYCVVFVSIDWYGT